MAKKTRVSGKFTTAEDLKNTFLKITGPRQQAKQAGDVAFSNDAGYWNGGRCDWGANHNLSEDSQTLANFFNSIAGINNEIDNIKLSANEEIFKSNKQQVINRIQGCINKCQATSSTSVAGVCIIWNDFFGNFLKKYLDEFSKKLKRQLIAVEKLEPKHQQDLLDLEAQAGAAKREYEENFRKANDPNLSEQEKAEFISLANKAAKRAEEIKRKVKSNPLAQASNFNFLDDLRALSRGNVPSNVAPDTKTPGGGTSSSNSSSSSTFFSQSQPNNDNQQLLILAVIAVAIIFLLLNKKESPQEYYEEY